MFDGSGALYWILVIGVLAYAASYFARGWLAGHQRFALYGGLVFLESTSRFLFALAVAVGIGSGQGAVGLGMAVAPFASLCVIPFAFSRLRVRGARGRARPPTPPARAPPTPASRRPAADLSLRHGAGFAAAVVGIMLSEQTLMNAGVLIVAINAGGGGLTSGLTGFVFNVMLIVRAPLQLFQAIQTSILPHLAGLEARESADEFRRAIRVTILVIAGFGLAVALGLLAIGPPVMTAFWATRASTTAASGSPWSAWDGAAPGLGDAQPGGAGARARHGWAASSWLICRGAVRRLRGRVDHPRPGDPGRGRLLRRHGGAVR